MINFGSSQSKFSAVFIPIFISCLLFQAGCATVFQGGKQTIEVTSNPSKAKVFVNDKQMSITPGNITVARRSPITIRLEREGFEPAVIEMKRGLNAWLLANVPWVSLWATAGYALQHKVSEALLGVAIYGIPVIGLDFLTGAAFKHRPSKIEAKLSGLGERVTP